jgi:hypothetical protein
MPLPESGEGRAQMVVGAPRVAGLASGAMGPAQDDRQKGAGADAQQIYAVQEIGPPLGAGRSMQGTGKDASQLAEQERAPVT